MRELRSFITQVRADLISQVLQPGRFSSPETGLTFHIRDRSPNGDLLGLLVHDERDEKQVMSYLAERGRIITNDEGSYLVMFDGYVHRYNAEDKDKNVQIVAFDQNMLDLSEFSPEGQRRQRSSAARELFQRPDQPRHERQGRRSAITARFAAELHDRLATPALPPRLRLRRHRPPWRMPAPPGRAAGARFSRPSASPWGCGLQGSPPATWSPSIHGLCRLCMRFRWGRLSLRHGRRTLE